LANLAANASNHRALLQENCLEFLIAGADLPDDDPPPEPISDPSRAPTSRSSALVATKAAPVANNDSLDEMALR
jgi:hypothetical protein